MNRTPGPQSTIASGPLRRAALAALLLALLPAAPTARSQDIPPESSTPAAATAAADRIAQARELADAKRFDEAAALLRGVVAADSSDTTAFSLLARVLAWGRRYDESVAAYRLLLARTPDDAFDRAGYARVLAWSGRHEASLREFRRAIAADSTNLETRIGYARAMSWSGDLPGASREYFRTLEADSSYGEAWLGLATVARWRGAATAADDFLGRAEARGADPEGVREERAAVRLALRPRTGLGWTLARERQYVNGSTTPFTLEASGPLAQAGATLGRAVGVRAQAGRLRLWERRSALPVDTTLNYDLNASVFQGDVSLLRFYPIQLSVGATYERLERRSPHVLYPLRTDEDFLGARGRVWGYWGRFTPSASVTRDFLPIKNRATRTLEPGGVTNAELALGWQWSPRVSASAAVSRGLYSDQNRRSGARAGFAYRMRLGHPRLTLDYTWSYTDYDSASASYFTPLASVRHAAGMALNGWSDRLALDYGVRYQFSPILSGNFPDLFINAWSGYVDAVLFDCIPIGVEGSYTIDNHQYTTWGLIASASVRW